MTKKVGVFLCKCSDNIAARVDVEQLKTALSNEDDIAFVETHELLCAATGQEFFEQKLKSSDVSHVVVAACSPKDHETTFQKCMKKVGKNKFLMQMANIREQCTWVTPNSDEAYQKSKALTLAAVRRVQLHEQLKEKEIACNSDVVVIGGGIAGIEAALLAASDGRKVTILEKSPSLGGMVTTIEEAAPNMECAPCMISPRISEIEDNENIEVMTNCDANAVAGYLGNFEIHINKKARMVDLDACIGCDECIQVCPVEVSSKYDYGMSKRKAIDVPFPGCFPNCAVVDTEACLKTTGQDCNACVEACPMEAMDFTQIDEKEVIHCGAVVLATGAAQFDPSDLSQLSLGAEAEVYTAQQFARLTSNHGPTGGKVVKKNGEPPKRIAFVHCVGRQQLGYCSGNCCEAAFGLGMAALSDDENTTVVHLVSDVVCPGELGSLLLQRVENDNGSRTKHATPDAWKNVAASMDNDVASIDVPPFVVRVDNIDAVALKKRADMLGVYFEAGGQAQEIAADMVVLVTGTQPSKSSADLMHMLDISTTRHGFAAPDHPILRPVTSSLDGVFLAGNVAGPGNISKSISSAKAAAGVVLSKLIPGKKMTIKTIVANADAESCCACGLCVQVCPYAAVKIDENRKVAVVNEVLCQGCGTCVATCPSGSASARHFTDGQLDAEVAEAIND